MLLAEWFTVGDVSVSLSGLASLFFKRVALDLEELQGWSSKKFWSTVRGIEEVHHCRAYPTL
jgi:hypothetical protein